MLHTTRGSERMQVQAFLNNVKGIFYYSTPHQGSPVAKNLAETIGESPMLTYFKTLSTDAARLNHRFDAISKVYEAWSFAGVGETRRTNLGLFEDIVAPEASTRGVNFNLVDGADHFSICRPRNKSVRRFCKLEQFVCRVATETVPFLESPAAIKDELMQSKVANEIEGLIAGLIKFLSVGDDSALQEHLMSECTSFVPSPE